MKRSAAIGVTAMLCIGLLGGCGTDYNTAEDTVFLLKNGKVVSTDVEDFDTNTYKKEDLEKFVEEAVEAYNSENGKGTIEKKKLQVEGGTAVLTLEYATAEDYAKFNGEELFSGSIAESLTAGYKYDTKFAALEGKQPEFCEAADILAQDGLKVAVFKGDANIHVAGKVVYASADNTKLIDKNTVGYALGNNIVTGEDTETTEVVEKETEATEQPETESVEESGSVGEDEFDLGAEEEETVVFDFEEDEAADQELPASTYIYVIYK